MTAKYKITLSFYITLFFVSIYASNAYKILVVCPFTGKSHTILSEGLVRHLANAGHEITYVTGHFPGKSHPNVSVVKVEYQSSPTNNEAAYNLKNYVKKTTNFLDNLKIYMRLMATAQDVLKSNNVQILLKDQNQHFDVAIVEWLWSDIYASFAEVFNCPLIWFSTMEPHWKVLRLIDEPSNPAYTTDLFTGSIPPFTFMQRVQELVYQLLGHVSDMWLKKSEYEIYEKYIVPIIRSKGREPASLEVITYNGSLIIGNSHVSLGVPTRLPDSYKSIGGYHIEKNVKPLPQDLIKIMNDAKHGIIYFSMGTNLKSKTFPDELKRALLKMFGKLKQTVLWKFEEDLPNCPDNVHILQWAPQQSILANEKCILFITHGGMLSTTEAVHFGVPIIGIPIFADQHTNVERAVRKGFARRIDLTYDLADNLYEGINEVLSKPIYRQKVKELSFIYHDRPISPGAELVHWVEHVVRTGGALHLRSPALNVTWYQKIYLDLLALMVVVAAVLIYTFKLLTTYINSKTILGKKVKRN